MHVSWKVAAAVAIGGLWADPAFGFGHKTGCGGGPAGVTTVTVPTTVTTTRTTMTAVPAVFGSVAAVPTVAVPTFVTGGTVVTAPAFVTGATVAAPLFATGGAVSTPGVVTVLTIPPPNMPGGTTPGCVTDAKIDQLITAVNQLNATLAQKPGSPNPGTNPPGLPPPNMPGTVAGVGPTPDFRTYEAAVDNYLRAGQRGPATAQFVLSQQGLNDLKVTVQDWEEANKRMAAKLGIKAP